MSFAVPSGVEEQAGYLRTILQQADEAYYNENESIMCDAAYDALRMQYDHLLDAYPELKNSCLIGATPKSGEKIAHSVPVLSLKKAYDDDAVNRFIQTCGTNLYYHIGPKLDGLTVVLRYRNGLLVQAVTRGDGKSGSDVTNAMLASGGAPLKIDTKAAVLDVRAEVVMSFEAFSRLNERRVREGIKPLKSPRNTASGTLRLHDYAEVSRRGIEIRVFELLKADVVPATHTDALQLIRSTGLPVAEGATVPADDVCAAVERMNRSRRNLPFPSDGVVIKVDSCAMYKKLGATTRHPRGALARKYKAVPVRTRLLRVEWSRGTSGKLTPVAHVEPVEVEGATIRSASLHNLNHLRALDLMIGDTVEVIRAGGSVPQIIGVCKALRNGQESPITPPEQSGP